MPGIKHLIECHCYLAIYKSDSKIPPVHKFPVYSKLDLDDKIIKKIVKCNNCEALHEITEVGVSRLIPGKDQTKVTVNKKDLSFNLPHKIKEVLYQYNCDISSWEHAIDIIEEKRWGETIVLNREIINEKTNVKIMEILGNNNVRIKNETIDEFLK